MTQKAKQLLKNKAISDLYQDERLINTINHACYRHRIPLDADIQSDILQIVMENLAKYDLDKFVAAYQDDPVRILKLAKKIALWKGVYLDKRCKKSWSHSIGQSIKYQSTLDTLQHINSCVEDSVENFNLPQVHIDDDEDNETQMWEYIRLNITPQEEELLDMLLDVDQPKLKGNLKKEYQALLPKLKEIILRFKQLTND